MSRPYQTPTWDGVGMIFNRDQLEVILDCIDYTYEHSFGMDGETMVEIALKIRKAMGENEY